MTIKSIERLLVFNGKVQRVLGRRPQVLKFDAVLVVDLPATVYAADHVLVIISVSHRHKRTQ